MKIYDEYVENEFFPTPLGHPTWLQFYYDALQFEAGTEKKLKYQDAIAVESSVPVVSEHLIKNFPQFDLNIPDQFRVDIWKEDYDKDLKAGTVPALSILWIIDDHTGGPPTAKAGDLLGASRHCDLPRRPDRPNAWTARCRRNYSRWNEPR